MTDTTTVPARLDRLPWSRFHTRLVVALGVTWVLDGLEITIAGAIGPRLQESVTLGISAAQLGFAASVYLFGEVLGALFFGRLADRVGRRRLFLVTLLIYLAGSGLTAASLDYWMFIGFRFIAGFGIGGEYAAINSAIDELIPAKHRGRVDLSINGTYWLGAVIGSLATSLMLDTSLFGVDVGWRLALLIGPLIALFILPLRRALPESPRWLIGAGRVEEAERFVDDIEQQVVSSGATLGPIDPELATRVAVRERVRYRYIARLMLREYPTRTVLGLVLGISQSFLYNAVFFSYTLVLTTFYGVSTSATPQFLFIFAIGNLLGPLLLGRYFDSIGRRPMIAGTYASSGALLILTGWLFEQDLLTAGTQTALWTVIFFIGSAAASSAYLTVSEVFPVAIRAQAIAFFFAIWQLVGGVAAPWIFGSLIGTGDRSALFVGYLIGGVLMIIAGITEWVLGVEAAGRPLEAISSADDGGSRRRSSVVLVRGTGIPPRNTTEHP
ncbi:MAG: MFS transporter [Actinomycetota bacterium]